MKYSHEILLAGRKTGKTEEEPTELHQAFLMPQRESDSNKTVIKRSELRNKTEDKQTNKKKHKKTPNPLSNTIQPFQEK